MASIEQSAAKYARNTQGRGSEWKSRSQANIGNYCQGIADKFGISVAACQSGKMGRNYAAGIQNATAADYDQGVSGKAQKWAQRFLQALQ